MTRQIYFITHAEVHIDPEMPVPDWALSEKGRSRHKLFNSIAGQSDIGEIYSSGEQKAIDGAAILSEFLGIEYKVFADLHENDRSATGYLPPPEFEKTADLFFEKPDESISGWETATAAQRRILSCVVAILQKSVTERNIAIVSHGGVGTLLLCHLSGSPITRVMDQPGTGGGNYFVFDGANLKLGHGWRSISETPGDG